MIINAYAVLDGFVTLLRLLVALAVTWLGIVAWRRCGGSTSPDRRKSFEDRCYLLFLLAFLLLMLNLSSWPLLYLLLQSYVPEWPGAMCIYGVTRVGAGSLGAARLLPGLVTALQCIKPLLVFLTGAWFVLYLINRQTRTAPLMSRVVLALIALGVLAAADSAVEAAYLVIPKKEQFLSTGCCTAASVVDSELRRLPQAVLGENWRPWLYAAYYTVNLGMVLTLARCTVPSRAEPTMRWLMTVFLGALLALPVGKLFLSEIAAPLLLHLPYHHCVYDLIPQLPESVVGISSFIFGSFSVAWACVAGWFGRSPETLSFLPGTIRSILFFGLLGYLGSLVMVSVELALL